MKQLTIVSGKGGTGKTTVTAAFSTLSDSHVIADCDVDAADLHLILDPVITQREEFFGGKTAQIDSNKCRQCDACVEACRFHAIEDYAIDPIACEGCGVCTLVCPEKAITMQSHMSGHWFVSASRQGPMVHASLGIGEDNSGKLVSLVRQQARMIAERESKNYIIIDGPPGIGCPVIAAITGVDLVLAVTEPTLSGIHDLERVVRVAKHFKVPVTVVINKYDINPDNTYHIEQYCSKNALTVAGKIPYNKCVTKAMVNRKSIIEYNCGEVTQEIERTWTNVAKTLN
jgi:MinD superfamily P-loop ATPase